jgi:hypothetical protein
MHPWKPWILVACLAAFAGRAAVIYKWTDANGVVHYSDQSVPGAEKIYTAGPAGSAASSSARANQNPPAPKPSAPAGLNYTQLSITSPTPEQTFFADEAISVHLALEPPLKPDHTVTWHLNGKQLDDQGPTATQFTLQSLERGTYAIAATVTDQASGESQSTGSVTFYVHQPSLLSPQHKKP